jgi:hypothetical protein
LIAVQAIKADCDHGYNNMVQSLGLTARSKEIVVISAAIRATIAVALTFGIAAALAQSASAAGKRHHHAAKPSEQYLRSAAPPADKAQK